MADRLREALQACWKDFAFAGKGWAEAAAVYAKHGNPWAAVCAIMAEGEEAAKRPQGAAVCAILGASVDRTSSVDTKHWVDATSFIGRHHACVALGDSQKRMGLRSTRFVKMPAWDSDYD